VPWLAERIRATDAPVPADVRQRLFTLDQNNRDRTVVMLNSAAELLSALREEGIDGLPLKGAALAPLYYPDPQRRPMADLDILVKPQHIQRGVAVMQRLGYRFFSRSAEDEVYLRGERDPNNVWSPNNVQPVEMHYALREEYAGLAYDLADMMWHSSREQPYWRGVSARVPSPAALLHHVCAHATSDWLIQRGKVMQIDDIRKIAARMTPADWEEFTQSITHFGARFVYPAIALAMKYTAVAIPAHIVDKLHNHTPPRLREWTQQAQLAGSSYSNPASRSGIAFGMSRLLAHSPLEQVKMLLHSVFPYRWNLMKRYPRLAASPAWLLCYVLLNADRVWHLGRKLIGRARQPRVD
jgi:hypothetical protein